nr:ribonuclease H-like domain-containing protein [Tanacetum cinerariifolium]
MRNPEGISDATTAIDMTIALMAKAFTLNNTTLTNNNQKSSSNLSNMQIAQPGMNMDEDKHMLMVEDNVGNQFRPNAVQNVRNQVVQNAVQNPGIQIVENMNGLSVVSEIANQCGNRNVVTAPAEGNGNSINDAYEETERVKASTSEEQYTELLEPIPEPYQVPQNDSNVISEVSSVEQGDKPPKNKGVSSSSDENNIDQYDPLFLYSNDTNRVPIIGFKLDGTYDSLVDYPDCICENSEKLKKHNQLLKLMQFLMGLDEVYAPIRSIILTTDPVHDVKGAFATLSRDKSHRSTQSHNVSKIEIILVLSLIYLLAKKAIESKCVFKVKYKSTGDVERFKASDSLMLRIKNVGRFRHYDQVIHLDSSTSKKTGNSLSWLRGVSNSSPVDWVYPLDP